MNNNAESIGRLLGIGIFIFGPLILIVLNAVSLPRHRTNALCALAIMSTLLAMMLLSLAGLGSKSPHVPMQVVTAMIYTGGGLMIVSCLMAIVGLIQCALRRRYLRGRWRAVIALGLNAIFLSLLVINTMAGLNQAEALRKLLHPATRAGAEVTSEAWNFRIQPPNEWSPIEPTVFGPNIRAAFGRNEPEMFTMVLAEDLPDGAAPSLAGAMDLLKLLLRKDGEIEVLNEEEKTDRDFMARTMETRNHAAAGWTFHVYWVMQDHGTLYRISTWGADGDAEKIREEARKISGGFQLLDTRRTKPKPTPKPTVAMHGTGGKGGA